MTSPNTPRTPEPEEDAPLDPRLARMFDQYRSSALFSSERALARNADAPDRVDVAELAGGRMHDPRQREALARQLISGERAIERVLPTLVPADDVVASPPRRSLRAFIFLSAAAALVVAAFGLGTLMLDVALGSSARITDGTGQEPRSGSERGPHRVVVTSHEAAYAALARVIGDAIVVEPLERDQLTLRLNPDEETLLPLDREIVAHGEERWLVLLSAEPFSGLLADLFARAARGEVPEGCAVREILVHGL